VFLENGSYVVVSRKFLCISISTVFLRRASVIPYLIGSDFALMRDP